MKGMIRAAAAVMIAGSVALPVSAQSGADIVERMLAEYERRSEGVENYTLMQTTMGVETVSYFEKEIVDGHPVFKLVSNVAAGMMVDGGGGGADEIFLMGAELTDRAEYAGREQTDGFDVHVLDIDDLSGMGFEEDMGDNGNFEPIDGRIFLDADTYAPRRLEFNGMMTSEQGAHEVNSTVVMGDYREVSGMLIPHRTVISITGLGEAIDPETRAQFEQMQRELENMPPAQRRMVESMMADQLAQFNAMMEGGDAPMTVEVTVNEVRVNTGAPGG
jgi:hypothetical protein